MYSRLTQKVQVYYVAGPFDWQVTTESQYSASYFREFVDMSSQLPEIFKQLCSK